MGLPFGGAVHTVPHLPQLLRSLSSLTQTPSQAENPAPQLTPQTPSLQVAAPFSGVGQVAPQAPQFCGSESVFTHEPSQFVAPIGQA